MKTLIWIPMMLLVAGACTQSEPPVTVEFRIAELEPGEGLTKMILSGGVEQTFYLHQNALLTGSDIDSAAVVPHRNGPAVEVLFSDEGRRTFAEVTALNMNKRLGMVIDGKLICAPVIRAQITQGKAIITGDFTEAEALRVAVGLTRN